MSSLGVFASLDLETLAVWDRSQYYTKYTIESKDPASRVLATYYPSWFRQIYSFNKMSQVTYTRTVFIDHKYVSNLELVYGL